MRIRAGLTITFLICKSLHRKLKAVSYLQKKTMKDIIIESINMYMDNLPDSIKKILDELDSNNL